MFYIENKCLFDVIIRVFINKIVLTIYVLARDNVLFLSYNLSA